MLFLLLEAKDEPLESIRASASDTKVTVTGLRPGTTYVFRVHSENALGRSAPSQELIVTTEEEGNCFLLFQSTCYANY